jgi:two-component system CheB/CheR fusion protein
LDQADIARLLDEIEQLHTALEASTEENNRLLDDREQLLDRIATQSRVLQRAGMSEPPDYDPYDARRSETNEELRVAFKELQVLTEELEVANTSLHEANRQLDHRVETRTHEIAEANAALTISEAAFRAITDLVPDLLWRTDRTGVARWYNRRWYDYTGQEPKRDSTTGWDSVVHPRDRAICRAAWQSAVINGEPYSQQHRVRGADGKYRWFLVRAEPFRNERGEVVQWFGAVTDIHNQRVAMEALQQGETRFRSLVEGVPQLVWRAVDGGRWTWSSPQWTAYTGLSEEASRQLGWLRAFHPDDRGAARLAWSRAVAGEPLDIEGRIYHKRERRHRHFRTRAMPVIGENGEVVEWLGTSTDVDDLLELQARQTTLLSELQHRVRNLLTMIRSVVRRSLIEGQSAEDYVQHLEGRLAAMARTQVLLTRKTNAGIELEDLIRDELVAQVADDKRVTIAGPSVMLGAKAAEVLALAIHELATNSLKYGALDRPSATIEINWVVERRRAERWLRLSWRESGVPIVEAAPRRVGFGTELITERVPYELRGDGEMALSPGGLHCTVSFPLSQGQSLLVSDPPELRKAGRRR